MIEAYNLTFWALWLIVVTVVVQALVASVAHRKQSQYVPGIVDSNLSHESFVFRSHRTFMNSLENVGLFLFPAIFAIWLGVDAQALAIITWVYALARIIHMVLYYAIATEKNPSPRSYFYMIALVTNLVLLGYVAAALV